MAGAKGQALGSARMMDEPPPFLILADLGHCFDLYTSLPSADPSGAQFVLEPDITGRFKLGKSVKIGAGVGYIAPLGGPLAGSGASMGGVRLRAELLF